MRSEMVDTIVGLVPRVSLDKRDIVVQDNDDLLTVQTEWVMVSTGEVVRRDGRVVMKRWPEGMGAIAGIMSPGD